MPFGKIIEKAFKYPWHNKALWFYGVLLAIFTGASSSNISNSIDNKTLESFPKVDFLKYIPYIIIGGIILFGLIILGWIVSSWAMAAIGKAIPSLEAGKTLNRKEMGKTGKLVVWDLIKLNYLLPFAIFLIAIVVIGVAVVWPLTLLPEQTGAMIGLILLIVFILLLIPLAIYLGVLWNLTSRAIIMDNTRVLDGFRSARKILKGHFWQTFLFSLIMGLIAGSVAIFFILPFIAVVALAIGGFASKMYALVAIGVIIGLLYLAFYVVAIGYLQATIQAGWSLWWLELKKVKAAA